MELTLQDKSVHTFRLSNLLIDRLKKLAKKENRSLNNYVETVLLDIAFNEPNEVTKEAMREVESGILRNTPSIDLTSIDAFEKSMGL